MKVLAVLPTFRRQELLRRTLVAVLRQTRPPDVIVVVDNERSRTTAQILEEIESAQSRVSFIYLEAPENLGSAGGWDMGMSFVLQEADDEDWILTLDDDDPPNDLDEIDVVSEFAQQQRNRDPTVAAVGIVGARFCWRTGHFNRPADEELQGPVEVDYVGSNHIAMYSVAVMRKMGVFRRDLFFGHTEVDYCLRLRDAGYRIVAHGDRWLKRRQHSGRVGIRSRPSRRVTSMNWRKYYSTRNYIVIMRERGRVDLALKRAWLQVVAKPILTLPHSPRLAWRSFRLATRASIDGFVGRMGRRIDPATFTST